MAKLTAPKGTGLPSLSTNGTVAAANQGVADDDGIDDGIDEKPTATEAELEESEHILADYLGLLPKGNLVTTGHISAVQ